MILENLFPDDNNWLFGSGRSQIIGAERKNSTGSNVVLSTFLPDSTLQRSKLERERKKAIL
jgi:hypothetical protein